MSDDVVKFPKRKKEQSESFLVAVPYSKCQHYDGPFEVDEHGGKCKCLKCGDEVTPIFVLMRLMNKESNWMRTRAGYQEEMKRLNERSRTKCQHCGQLTRISRA